MSRIYTRLALVAAAAFGLAATSAMPAAAQYDRDGRYVPSPMGKPADPYARSIPNYSGKPGGAIGTPSWPRAYDVKPPAEPELRREAPIKVYPSAAQPVAVSKELCAEGWSKATGMTKVVFNRRCARLARSRRD